MVGHPARRRPRPPLDPTMILRCLDTACPPIQRGLTEQLQPPAVLGPPAPERPARRRHHLAHPGPTPPRGHPGWSPPGPPVSTGRLATKATTRTRLLRRTRRAQP